MPQTPELKIDQRRKRILEIMSHQPQIKVSQLSQIFHTSTVTIRHDLDALASSGFVKRISGGAVLLQQESPDALFCANKQKHADLKQRIANCALNLIQDGDTIFLNSGTTTYFTAVALKKRKNLNIVTNSIHIAMELSSVSTFRVKLLGGDLNCSYLFTYGNDALELLSRFKADKAILSVSGICCGASGLTTYHPEEAALDRMMIERSRETYLVADSTKFDHEGFYPICPIDQINLWVTAGNIDPVSVAACEKQGVSILCC